MTIYLTGVTNAAIRDYAATEPALGIMVQPRSRLLGQVAAYRHHAADNGVFGAYQRGVPFDATAWLRFLDKLPAGGLFAVVPDVVANHQATRAAWPDYARHVIDRGHRPAFAIQNGCTDLAQVPDDAAAVFIGGDDAYKLGHQAARVAWQARRAGLWVHMGRVNSTRRWLRALAMGCDSADGTFLRFGSAAEMIPRLAQWLAVGRSVGGQLSLLDHLDTPPERSTDTIPL